MCTRFAARAFPRFRRSVDASTARRRREALRRPGRSRTGQSHHRPTCANRARRPERRRQDDAPPDPGRRRATGRRRRESIARAVDRRLPGAGTSCGARRVAARGTQPTSRRCAGGARARRVRAGPRSRSRGGRALLRRARAFPGARWRGLRGTGTHHVRGARALARSQPRAHGLVGRRGREDRSRLDSAVAVRPAPTGRAHERPRLRRSRPHGAVPRCLSRRPRRGVARPRVPRPNRRPDRLDRAGLAPRARVGGRLERLRGGQGHGAPGGAGGVRAGASAAQALDGASRNAADGSSLARCLARCQDRRSRPESNPRAGDEGASGRTSPREERAAWEAVPALGARAHAAMPV